MQRRYRALLHVGVRRLRRRQSPLGDIARLGLGLCIALLYALSAWPQKPAPHGFPVASDVRVDIASRYLGARLLGRTGVVVLREPRVTALPDDSLRIHLNCGIGPISLPAGLVVQPTVRASRLRSAVLSARLAGLPVPRWLAQSILDASAGGSQTLPGLDAAITGVRVTAHGLEIAANAPH